MGEKMATNEVISRLTDALKDTDHCVRRNACGALEKMGAKAATIEVMNALISVLRDINPDVRRSANAILCKIGGKAATNELIRRLLNTCNDKNPDVQYGAIETTGNILSLLSSMSQFDDFTIEELFLFIHRFKWKLIDKLSPEKFFRAFLDTKMPSWLPVIKLALILQSNAATMTNDTMTLYGNNESVELTVADIELRQKIKDVFINWMDEPYERRNH
jgi:HEAT repeat protein